jgi:uncharacterized protein (DUF1810 family)
VRQEPSGFDLERFLSAQGDGGTYDVALAELRRGRKVTHWMWFVFPQYAGLGHSPTAMFYAIGSLDEARAYLAHPTLGGRLSEAAQALLDLDPSVTAEQVLGPVDAMKLRSSMTLFDYVAADAGVFADVLDRYFNGRRDEVTLELVGS